MTTNFSSGHERRQQASRMYMGALVLLTLVVIAFAVVLVRSTSPSAPGPIHSISNGLVP